MRKSGENSGWKIFLAGFGIMIVLLVVSTFRERRGQTLEVRDNKGMGRMSTVGDSLVAVFQDGQTVIWDWSDLGKPLRQFKVPSDRAVFFSGGRLGVISKTDSMLFSVYDLQTGRKQKDIRIGSAGDEVWPAVSPDRRTILIVRRVAAPGEKNFSYEFLTLYPEDELLGLPTAVSIAEPSQSITDFAVTDGGIVVAAGMQNGKGRLLALDLNSGRVLWDRTYDDTREFCSLVLSPDHTALYAGNRDGKLYKIHPESGNLEKEIVLLQEGETRAVTNDVSVLNLSMDPAGQYVAATITPVSYIVDAPKGERLKRWSSARKLSSKIAFSPDLRYVATSDIRAGWPIDIWELEKLKK